MAVLKTALSSSGAVVDSTFCPDFRLAVRNSRNDPECSRGLSWKGMEHAGRFDMAESYSKMASGCRTRGVG